MEQPRVKDGYMKGREAICKKLYALCEKYEVDPQSITVSIGDMGGLSITTDSKLPQFLIDIQILKNLSYETCFICGGEGRISIDKRNEFITICKRCQWKLGFDRDVIYIMLYIKKFINYIKKLWKKIGT